MCYLGQRPRTTSPAMITVKARVWFIVYGPLNLYRQTNTGDSRQATVLWVLQAGRCEQSFLTAVYSWSGQTALPHHLRNAHHLLTNGRTTDSSLVTCGPVSTAVFLSLPLPLLPLHPLWHLWLAQRKSSTHSSQVCIAQVPNN